MSYVVLCMYSWSKARGGGLCLSNRLVHDVMLCLVWQNGYPWFHTDNFAGIVMTP